MSRMLKAPASLYRLIVSDNRQVPVRNRARVFSQATGQSLGRIIRESTFRENHRTGSRPYAFYFEYAHRVIYRGRVRFPVRIATFDTATLEDAMAQPSVPLKIKSEEQEIIEGNHFIFRPAGTFHAVFIEDDVFARLFDDREQSGLVFDKVALGATTLDFLQCEKDFDQDGETSG